MGLEEKILSTWTEETSILLVHPLINLWTKLLYIYEGEVKSYGIVQESLALSPLVIRLGRPGSKVSNILRFLIDLRKQWPSLSATRASQVAGRIP